VTARFFWDWLLAEALIFPSFELISLPPQLSKVLPFPVQSSLGVVYGTNSVRALIVDCSSRAELGNSVADYPNPLSGLGRRSEIP
jgi:hypothetical protein